MYSSPRLIDCWTVGVMNSRPLVSTVRGAGGAAMPGGTNSAAITTSADRHNKAADLEWIPAIGLSLVLLTMVDGQAVGIQPRCSEPRRSRRPLPPRAAGEGDWMARLASTDDWT